MRHIYEEISFEAIFETGLIARCALWSKKYGSYFFSIAYRKTASHLIALEMFDSWIFIAISGDTYHGDVKINYGKGK